MSLESKNYVATLEDVARITREVLDAKSRVSEGRATFFSAVIATTQSELGLTPRLRTPSSTGKLSAEETAEQLAALEKVGTSFYDVVVKLARQRIQGPDRGGVQLQKLTGFARSSLSTIRKWVRRGNDITGLVAARTTKAALYIPGKAKPSVKVLGNRTRRYSDNLERTLATLAHTDVDAARKEWLSVKARMERIFAKRGSTTGRHIERRIAA